MAFLKAILLAGGNGSRLYPSTLGVSKHLLPIFDKPLIYYSLSSVMLSGIKEAAVVTQRKDLQALKSLLGDGSRLGMKLTFLIQDEPLGIADTIRLAEQFLDGTDFLLALGDNVFFGSGLSGVLRQMAEDPSRSRILVKEVMDPERFGVAWLNGDGKVTAIVEKPNAPTSKFAITGLYFFDKSAVSIAKSLTPSDRGELEITDVLSDSMLNSQLRAWVLPRGTMWLDTGTIESMMNAAEFVRSFQSLSGQLIGSPEEVAWRNGWIDSSQLRESAAGYQNSYGAKLIELVS